jgi:hypothetical protein
MMELAADASSRPTGRLWRLASFTSDIVVALFPNCLLLATPIAKLNAGMNPGSSDHVSAVYIALAILEMAVVAGYLVLMGVAGFFSAVLPLRSRLIAFTLALLFSGAFTWIGTFLVASLAGLY